MKKIGILSALLFLVLCAFPDISNAAVRYVRAGAGGNGSGSDWTNAYTALPSSLVRGDTYYIAKGSYAGKTFGDAENGAWIKIKKATVSDHGTNTGWNNSYADGPAVFNGTLKFNTGSYEIDGQTGGGPGNWTSGHGIKVQYTGSGNTVKLINIPKKISNLTFKHMELSFKPCSSCTGQDAIYAIYGGTNWKFQYLWAHHPSRVVFYTQQASNILVEYSLLERSGTNGSSSQHSEIWSARDTHDVTVRHNYIRDYRSTGGIIMGRASKWNIYGNIFQWTVDFGGTSNNGAIGSWSSDSTYYAKDIKVYNNTFVDLKSGGSGKIFPIYKSLSNVVAYNNLWYNSPSVAFGGAVKHDYNWFKNSNEGKISESNMQVGSGDPFVSLSGKDFRLRASTKTGTSLSSPFNIDMLGIVRGSNGIWDRGAFQFGGTVNVSTTPEPPASLTVQ